ncbi:MAG TPA: hypothetical protein V6D29_13905 [Leptolyngbyaceae cyanobacterium]
MGRKCWLQYHNFEENGFPTAASIKTNKAACEAELALSRDIIFLMVGLNPSELVLKQFGLTKQDISGSERGRVYFLWEKFLPTQVKRVGERPSGGFSYEVSGDVLDTYRPPILLTSLKFKGFWHSYHRHGFICLSELGMPFPELEKTGDFEKKQLPKGKVVVSEKTLEEIKFLKAKLGRVKISNLSEVDQLLKQYGLRETAEWINTHSADYYAGLRNGFEVVPAG